MFYNWNRGKSWMSCKNWIWNFIFSTEDIFSWMLQNIHFKNVFSFNDVEKYSIFNINFKPFRKNRFFFHFSNRKWKWWFLKTGQKIFNYFGIWWICCEFLNYLDKMVLIFKTKIARASLTYNRTKAWTHVEEKSIYKIWPQMLLLLWPLYVSLSPVTRITEILKFNYLENIFYLFFFSFL